MSSDPAVHTIQFRGTGVFNPETLADVHEQLDAALANEKTQAVFLRGEGKNFSQGLDLEYLSAHQEIFSQFVTDTMFLAGRMLAFPHAHRVSSQWPRLWLGCHDRAGIRLRGDAQRQGFFLFTGNRYRHDVDGAYECLGPCPAISARVTGDAVDRWATDR